MMLFVASDPDDAEYTSLGVAFVTTFCQMMLAAFNPARFTKDPVLAISFMASEFFINIVMLNALVAIMGNTYDRVSQTKQSRGLCNRAAYILERQRLMSEREQKNKLYFPDWLHVLERDHSSTAADEGALEQGDGSGIAHQANKLRMEMAKMEEKIAKKMSERTEEINKAVLLQGVMLNENMGMLKALRAQIEKATVPTIFAQSAAAQEAQSPQPKSNQVASSARGWFSGALGGGGPSDPSRRSRGSRGSNRDSNPLAA